MEELSFSRSGSTSSQGLEEKTVLTLAKGSLIGLIGRLLGRFLMLLYQILLARSLGRDQYGLFSLGWSVLQISLYLGPVGIQQAILRFASPLWKKDEAGFRRIVQQAVIMAILSGILLGGALFAFSPLLANFFGKPALTMVWRGVALALLLSSILRALSATTRVSRKVQFSALVEDILLPFSMAVIALGVTVFRPGGVRGALFSVIMGYVLMTALAWYFVRSLFPSIFAPVNWQRAIFRTLSAFSLPASLVALLNLLIQWLPRLVLGYFRPEAEVGLYQAAFQVATLPALVLASTGPIFIPVIARLIGEKDFQQVNEVYKVTTKWTLYLSAPLLILMFFYPETFIRLLFGGEYSQASLLFLILLSSQVVNAATGGVLPLHLMLGYERRVLWIQSLTFLATILTSIWWTAFWGGTGTALATTFGIALGNLLALISLWKIGYFPFDQRYWKGGVALGCSLLPVLGLAYLYPENIWSLVLAGVLSVLVFLGVLWRLGFDVEEKYFVHVALQTIWRPK